MIKNILIIAAILFAIDFFCGTAIISTILSFGFGALMLATFVYIICKAAKCAMS